MKRHLTAALCAAGSLLATGALAQTREPLCVTTAVRRLVSAPYLQVNGSDFLVARPLPSPAADGAAFVVAVRDPDHSLRVGDARELPRTVDEMEFERPQTAPDRDPGLTVLRLDRTMRVVGEPTFLPDPVRGERGQETYAPGIPAGATVDDGVLVVQHVAGDLYATVVPPSGPVPTPRRVAQAPAVTESGHRGYVWFTLAERRRGDARGAALLAGTDDGEVTALAFDGHGARVAEPVLWGQHVGGAMQLAVMPGGDTVAILERPVRGTAMNGSQAREQVLVRLSPTLEPLGEPERLGLGPYPTTAVPRGDDLVVSQWAESRGLAVATLPSREGRLQLELPRLWTTSPLEGIPLAHVAIRGAGNILYDLMLHGDDVAGGLHAYVTWQPPAGPPFPRRDVIPWRARMITRPALLPAEDGVVVLMAAYDELGGGIDAAHVRCELTTLPARAAP
jgi:hypothetical protein